MIAVVVLGLCEVEGVVTIVEVLYRTVVVGVGEFVSP